jgi:cytochrome bd-type quinol oxidase subunit 2
MILKDILAFGIVVYVVLDCFDLRVGIRYRVGTPSPHLR